MGPTRRRLVNVSSRPRYHEFQAWSYRKRLPDGHVVEVRVCAICEEPWEALCHHEPAWVRRAREHTLPPRVVVR